MTFLSDIVPFLLERKIGIDTMQPLQSFVLVLLFSCEILSAPTPTITCSQLQVRSFKPLSSGNSQANTGDDQTGEVSAVSVQGDAQFVSLVTIGGQTIVMSLDTDSADLQVLTSY